jgi:predicted acetyltransferase
MGQLILRTLHSQDEEAFLEGLAAWPLEDQSWHSFIWPSEPYFSKMLQLLEDQSKGINLAPGRVPATMYYAFVDGKIVGRLHIRHKLNQDLEHRGGHMGYAVAPPFRKKGYATEIVKQAVPILKNLGLNRILVTCADDNIPSWKIIENIGGVLENKVWDNVDEEMIRRYWVSLETT